MESQAAFVLVAFLYLASPLATVQAVTKIKVLVPKKSLILECENRTAADKSVEWQKEGVDVRTAFDSKEDLVKVFENGSLAIHHKENEESIFGNYTCNTTSSGNVSARYRVVPKPIATLGVSVSVVEGEKLQVTCIGKLLPGVKITWTFAGKTYNTSEGRVQLVRDEERGINRGKLVVDNIEMSDEGNVTCAAAYDWSDPEMDHRTSATTLLRVKDKLAALWPFLGICAEVVVLCAIILIYEKKRNKAELEESDTDQSPDTKPTPNKDSDVRQRK
ncbi:basigin isoform X2 [Venturia canescens]|uniref:basigin isoform X2 n=1 Tax=Venturia canescens TaxID=32260 RepID=UPI001C9BE9AE|nr:basigin isoform X2 [Venturia canescens]